MAEATHDKKEFPCAQCGAKLEFKPGTEKLVCGYCGHENIIYIKPEASGSVVEHDFNEAIRNAKTIPASSLAPSAKEIQCSTCGAISTVTDQSTHCAFCGAPIVVENIAPTNENVIAPESVLPFKIDKKEAQNEFKKWIESLWFAPNDLSKRAQTTGIDGVYLPYWTYDSATYTNYIGQRGEYYYVTETYTNSKGESETREVRKTRWYPTSGSVSVDFDDVLVCASKSLPHTLVDELEPWDLNELKPYDSRFLSGFVTERYKIDLEGGFEMAKDKMSGTIDSTIRRDIGGDEQIISSKNTKYSNITFKHLLLPLWISSFRYGEKIFRFVINARTGEVAGERPWSWIKITLAAIAGAITAGGLYYLYEMFGK